MPAIRRLLDRKGLAALLFAAALLLKLLIPAGYMIAGDRGRVTIELCSGIAGQPMTMAGMHGAMPAHGKDHGKPEMPCAFAGLATAALGAVDPVLLADHLAFVTATGIAPLAASAILTRPFLRPPLRGPPSTR